MTWGWIGNVFALTCAWRLSKRQRKALIFGMIADCLWMVEASEKGMPDLLFIEMAFLCLSIRNFILWGRSDARTNLDVHSGPASE